ncbi:MAG: CoA transferase [Dehalococcoidia bacterium]|nr:CoA transferase [Dehalococcoidia bacterium]
MSGILEGLRVVEMGHWVAVPSACAVLADWGAEVIKIEPLTGESARGLRQLGEQTGDLFFNGVPVNWRIELHNRGKRGLAVDAIHESGREIICKLARWADVFMTNYELESLTRLRLDYARLSQENPKLIYALLTGYGTKGPDKDERGFDYAAAWAHSGIQFLLGEPGSPPPPPRGGMMDRTAGFQMLAGIMAALLHREKTGEGQELHVSLYHTGVWTLAADIEAALLGVPLPKYERHKIKNPLANLYRTKDDRWIQMIMLQSDLQWHGFCRAIGKPELENDPRFNNMLARAVHCEELISLLDAIFATRTLAEWEPLLRENKCIFSRIQTPAEVTTDPQAAINGFFSTIPHPVAQELKLVNSPVHFQQNPARIKSHAPEIGQHTEEVLLEIGYSWEDIARLKEERTIL